MSLALAVQTKGFGASFLDCNGIPSGLPLPKARTIDPGSPVIADLLDSPLECNTIDRRNVFREEPFGFVVTNGFLEKLGFHGDSVKSEHYLTTEGFFEAIENRLHTKISS